MQGNLMIIDLVYELRDSFHKKAINKMLMNAMTKLSFCQLSVGLIYHGRLLAAVE